jgi:hypothetical protein
VAWPSFYTQGDTIVAGLHARQMLHDSEWWRSPTGLGPELSFHLARCADGTCLAGPVHHYHAWHVNDVFCKSTTEDFRRASSMRVPRGDTDILTGFACHATRSLVLRDRSRAFSLSHFIPARGDAFACKLPSPQGGDAFISSFPAKGKGLAWCPTTPCRADCLG